jgi:hypothetical protein
MLLFKILSYCRLFHLKLFLSIIDYCTLDFFVAIISNFNIWLLVVILLGLLVVINGQWWLLMVILLVVINGY